MADTSKNNNGTPIPLLADLADSLIAALFDRQRAGTLSLPDLCESGNSPENHVALWLPESHVLSNRQYALGLSRAFERRGTVTLPIIEEGQPVRREPLAQDIFRIKVKIFSRTKLNVGQRNAEYRGFLKSFHNAVIEVLGELILRNSDTPDFLWLRERSEDGTFSAEQIKEWFEFRTLPPPKLLTRDAIGFFNPPAIRVGDVIFHGDGGGAHSGTLGLFVERGATIYGLSARHVLSLYGKAAPNTDIFARQRGRGEQSRKRIGQFSGEVVPDMSFQPLSNIRCDTALFAVTVPTEPNEIFLARRGRRVGALVNVMPSEHDERPAVMIARPNQTLQIAEVEGVNAATPMLGLDDTLLFYEGLLDLRVAKRNVAIVPSNFIPHVRLGGVISKPGDSGALVIQVTPQLWQDTSDVSAAAVLIGGNSVSGIQGVAYAHPILHAKNELDFELHVK